MTPPEINARPGDVLAGKYAVERVLGQGGMGAVLAVRHLMLDERRALKLMLPSAMGGHQAVERFVREARAAARLKSDHVTRVHDVGLLPTGQPYIEMELLEGEDLAAMLVRRGPLPPAEVIGWVLQVCEALQEAHGAGVIHRDLKPANLFVTRRPNGSECVKVLDFGVAKIQGAQDASLTSTGLALGSPLYMSPEQMYGASHAETRSDLWSLGVIMFQLLTGKVPFNGESVTAVALAVVNTPTPSPAIHRADLPPALEAIVMRCLQKAPAARFASAGELAAALHAARDGVPYVAPDLSSAQPALAAPPRAPSPSLAGLSDSASTVALPLTPAALPAPAAPGPHASTFDTPVSIMPRPQPRRLVVPLLAALSVGAVGLVGGAVWMARSPSPAPAAGRAPSGQPGAASASAAAPAPLASATAEAPATAEPVASSSGGASASSAPGPIASSKPAPASSGSSAKRPDSPATARPTATTTAPKKGGGFTGVD